MITILLRCDWCQAQLTSKVGAIDDLKRFAIACEWTFTSITDGSVLVTKHWCPHCSKKTLHTVETL